MKTYSKHAGATTGCLELFPGARAYLDQGFLAYKQDVDRMKISDCSFEVEHKANLV